MWCKAQIACCRESDVARVFYENKVNEAKSVPDMACVCLNPVSCLPFDRSLWASFQVSAEHIRHILTFILLHTTSTTLLPHGDELTQSVLGHCNQRALELYFPLSPTCLVIYHHKSQKDVSKPQRGHATLIERQRSSRALTAFSSVKEGFCERTREGFTWIREFLMTRLTSSRHSATSGLWSSRFDEKASRWERKYSAGKK